MVTHICNYVPWKRPQPKTVGNYIVFTSVFLIIRCDTHRKKDDNNENRTDNWYFFFPFKSIQYGLFWGCSRMRRAKRSPLPKNCQIYPTMMKLDTVVPYLKKIQKIYKSRDTLNDFCWHQHLLPKDSNLCCINKCTDIDGILMHSF